MGDEEVGNEVLDVFEQVFVFIVSFVADIQDGIDTLN